MPFGRIRPAAFPSGNGQEAVSGELLEKVMQYPANSRMYLYLLNNLFDTNICWTSPGR